MPKRRRLALVLSALLLSSPLWAADRTYDLRIPQQSLQGALTTFARQSGLEIVYESSLVAGRTSPEVRGTLTAEQVLQRMLEGTGLASRFINGGAIAISAADAPALRRDGGQDGQFAAPGADSDAPAAGAPPPSTRVLDAAEAGTLDTVVVTGTRIRGGATPSPVITIGSERIRDEGFTDLGDVIRSIPQNFGGGQNPGVATGATAGAGGAANQNITGGSSLNLRGLGADASLTLLNGRRLSYGGFAQAVDIGAIPVAAVDRIEIVADGASAIYGSDAVGGVGNVVLKRDFSGVALGALHGGASGDGLRTREYTGTAGAAWSSGGLIATYKHASVAPIQASQRDYTAHMASPTTIYPGGELRSGLVSGHQAWGDRVALRLDALRTEREQKEYRYYSGVASYYGLLEPRTTTTLVAPAVDVRLGDDWQLSFGAAWGRDERVQRETMIFLATGQAMPSPYDDCYCNRSRGYEVGAEGPLFAAAGGDARLALGTGYRHNAFVQRNVVSGETSIEGDEGSRFAYAELSVPLLEGDAAGAAGRRLMLSAAVRGEDYDSFGSVATPKLGLVYSPGGDYTLKTSWGRSFKAPTLLERYQSQNAILFPAAALGGSADPQATVLSVFGGNPDLQAERARTWTASVAFHPRTLPALEAELTWFDIDYTERVVQPIGNYGEALTNPVYGRYVDWSPAAAEQARVIAATSGFFNYTGGSYDPAHVVALLHAQYVNVAQQRIRGVDLSGSYRFDLGPGRLTLRGSTSWLDSEQRNSPEERAFDLAGMLYSPSKVNGRVGLVWHQGGFTASTFANYTGGVTTLAGEAKTASFTTVDANLVYSLEGGGRYARDGWDFALSAHNLLDRAPPLHSVVDPTWVPYDSTNYSAIGRFLSLSVTRRF